MDEQHSAGQTPTWYITFSDLMALLLTFFIMVVSFSELKSEEKYQALMDGFQEQFGTADTESELGASQIRRRNSQLSKMVSAGHKKRESVYHLVSQDVSSQPLMNSVPLYGRDKTISAGSVLYFQVDQIELDDSQRLLLRQQADGLRAKPFKVEIRGHSSFRLSPPGATARDHWDLSYERCRKVMQFLVEEQQIDPRRLRISASAEDALQSDNPESAGLQAGSRVELLLHDELVNDTNSN
jgi:chemotaxis protein MotB